MPIPTSPNVPLLSPSHCFLAPPHTQEGKTWHGIFAMMCDGRWEEEEEETLETCL